MTHKWALQDTKGEFRFYYCDCCETGPVRIRAIDSKRNITAEAKRQGFAADCNLEIVRKVIES